jgi:DNA-binding transcriptional MerR regulator
LADNDWSELPEGNEPSRRDGLLTTGDMARRSGSTLRTVRFYEECGVLSPALRTEGGHRLFAPAELKKLVLVSDLRTAGFSLEEIKATLAAKLRSGSGREASREVITHLDRHLTSLSERIALLSRLHAELTSARQLLELCDNCTDSPHFPHACGSCRVMADRTDVPEAVSVLWGIER